ncbi:MAG: DUF47 family protein [Thermoplasmatales archaeon]|jgi:uncharacterized protein Yka (UPF0111/DUF47 family)|nr:DUF47 family protein [Thermoplasmatales archaeon]
MEKPSLFKRFTSIGERNLLNELTVYPDLAVSVADVLIKMMEGERGALEVLNETVKMKEKEGDNYSKKFNALITRGAINPSLIDNLLFLINRLDDVIDRSYYLSREIKRMNFDYMPTNGNISLVIGPLYQKFVHMLTSGKDAMNCVKGMLSETGMDKIRDYRKKIEIIEEAVDDLKDSVLDETYRRADEMNYIVFNHVTSMVHKIDDMVDDCEDAADLILSIYESLTR